MFSIITIAGIDQSPRVAIAIPAQRHDIGRHACCCKTAKASRMPTGSVAMATSEERKCSRK